MKTKIYILTDSNNKIRYVGKTCHTLHTRLMGHLWGAQHGIRRHVCNWIRFMIERGCYPKITLLGEVDGNGNRAEVAWIKYLQSEGCDLTNISKGGGGANRWRKFKEAEIKLRKSKNGKGHKVIDLSRDLIFKNSVEYNDSINYPCQADSRNRFEAQ